MQEKEPLYFTKFREHIDKKFETHVPEYFTKFREHIDEKFVEIDKKLGEHSNQFKDMNKTLTNIDGMLESHSVQLVKIEDKLDSHFEAIGEVKVQIVEIGMLLKHKASKDELESLEHRTKSLEKLAFA